MLLLFIFSFEEFNVDFLEKCIQSFLYIFGEFKCDDYVIIFFFNILVDKFKKSSH